MIITIIPPNCTILSTLYTLHIKNKNKKTGKIKIWWKKKYREPDWANFFESIELKLWNDFRKWLGELRFNYN